MSENRKQFPLHQLWIKTFIERTPETIIEAAGEYTLMMVLIGGLQVMFNRQTIPIPLPIIQQFTRAVIGTSVETSKEWVRRLKQPPSDPPPAVAFDVEYQPDTGLMIARTPHPQVLRRFEDGFSLQLGQKVKLLDFETIDVAQVYRLPSVLGNYGPLGNPLSRQRAVQYLVDNYQQQGLSTTDFADLFHPPMQSVPARVIEDGRGGGPIRVYPLPDIATPSVHKNEAHPIAEYPPQPIIREEPEEPKREPLIKDWPGTALQWLLAISVLMLALAIYAEHLLFCAVFLLLAMILLGVMWYRITSTSRQQHV